MAEIADLWFDPACPSTWIASRRVWRPLLVAGVLGFHELKGVPHADPGPS